MVTVPFITYLWNLNIGKELSSKREWAGSVAEEYHHRLCVPRKISAAHRQGNHHSLEKLLEHCQRNIGRI